MAGRRPNTGSRLGTETGSKITAGWPAAPDCLPTAGLTTCLRVPGPAFRQQTPLVLSPLHRCRFCEGPRKRPAEYDGEGLRCLRRVLLCLPAACGTCHRPPQCRVPVVSAASPALRSVAFSCGHSTVLHCLFTGRPVCHFMPFSSYQFILNVIH